VTITAFLRRLRSVRRCSDGWTARCPGHEDKHNSLSVTPSDDKILVHCHTGCPPEKVLAAINLTLRDLFDADRNDVLRGPKGAVIVYDYRSETGELLYQVVRGKNKSFKQRRPGLAGEWIYNLSGVRRVPYRLPQLLASDQEATIFVVEGEKDVDNLVKRGLIGTTNSGGAGKWPKDARYNEPFQGRNVAILPDNDEAGHKHAELVAETLTRVGASVKVIRLDSLPGKSDVSDWLGSGHSIPELTDLVSRAGAWRPGGGKPAGRHAQSVVSDPLMSLRKLGKKATFKEIDSALREMAAGLSKADGLTIATAREEAISLLKGRVSSPARLVDVAMPKEPETNSEVTFLSDPELWPEPVDGALLLNDMAQAVLRFVCAPMVTIRAVVLWALYTHVFDSFFCSPILAITSPDKGCGKTTLLELLGALVRRNLTTSNITPASLYRTIERYQPTLLIDEADTFFRNNEELRGLINSGHTRTSAKAVRTVGENYDVRAFSTFSPKAISMIGSPPGTIEDRSIHVRLQRKSKGERTEYLRQDRLKDLEILRSRAARWAQDNGEMLALADPEIPDGITNARARDNWRPLVAVADAAGGQWGEWAREAATVSTGRALESESAAVLLLSDMREVFRNLGDQVESGKVIDFLVKLEERPWADWRQGRELTTNGLARLLKSFESRPGIKIAPTKWRDGDETVRGYQLRDFQDAFTRYVPEEDVPASDGRE
jgi:5S rRNA maturation endonuclease (ribonuclease M5)